MMTAMKWFYGFLKKYRLRMFFGMVLVTILAAAALASPYISKIIVDTVIKGGKTEYLIPLVGILVAGQAAGAAGAEADREADKLILEKVEWCLF